MIEFRYRLFEHMGQVCCHMTPDNLQRYGGEGASTVEALMDSIDSWLHWNCHWCPKRVPVDGSYPFEDQHGPVRWVATERVSTREAMRLLGIPKTFEQPYLWLNKGFIRLGARRDILLPRPAYNPKDWPEGTEAVYLHDGSYSIIRRVRR